MSSSATTSSVTTTTTTVKRDKITSTKPNPRNTSYQYWKSLFYKCDARRREGWHQYYDSNNNYWRSLNLAKKLVVVAGDDDTNNNKIPPHIKDEYLRLVTAFDSSMTTERRECSICLSPFTFDTSMLTDCGHLFHTTCIQHLPTCPLCRGKFKKHSSPSSSSSSSSSPIL